MGHKSALSDSVREGEGKGKVSCIPKSLEKKEGEGGKRGKRKRQRAIVSLPILTRRKKDPLASSDL